MAFDLFGSGDRTTTATTQTQLAPQWGDVFREAMSLYNRVPSVYQPSAGTQSAWQMGQQQINKFAPGGTPTLGDPARAAAGKISGRVQNNEYLPTADYMQSLIDPYWQRLTREVLPNLQMGSLGAYGGSGEQILYGNALADFQREAGNAAKGATMQGLDLEQRAAFGLPNVIQSGAALDMIPIDIAGKIGAGTEQYAREQLAQQSGALSGVASLLPTGSTTTTQQPGQSQGAQAILGALGGGALGAQLLKQVVNPAASGFSDYWPYVLGGGALGSLAAFA
jgi:hypothetical protein